LATTIVDFQIKTTILVSQNLVTA